MITFSTCVFYCFQRLHGHYLTSFLLTLWFWIPLQYTYCIFLTLCKWKFLNMLTFKFSRIPYVGMCLRISIRVWFWRMIVFTTFRWNIWHLQMWVSQFTDKLVWKRRLTDNIKLLMLGYKILCLISSYRHQTCCNKLMLKVWRGLFLDTFLKFDLTFSACFKTIKRVSGRI